MELVRVEGLLSQPTDPQNVRDRGQIPRAQLTVTLEAMDLPSEQTSRIFNGYKLTESLATTSGMLTSCSQKSSSTTYPRISFDCHLSRLMKDGQPFPEVIMEFFFLASWPTKNFLRRLWLRSI